MGNTYGPGRTRWTGTTGWLMVGSAAAAVLCAIVGVSPYPPLTVEVCLAGSSALFAACWVAASLHARRVPPRTELRKRPPGRPRGRLLRIVLSFGIPLATFAALVLCFTESGEEGRRVERLERAGYDRHEARIVRLAGEPVHHPATDDDDAYYSTDVVLGVPYDDGPRDVAVAGVSTRERPAPGVTAEVFFAPGHPEVGVGTSPARAGGELIAVIFFIALGPWPFVAGAAIKSYMEPGALERMRRFDPGTHLPALGLLLLGVLALLPAALDVPVAGSTRLWALLALPAPALALTWTARRA
ncbi:MULTISPECIES: hypothetical protein [Streptomyces]|uniref:hypothetical protein n=1 Tax=Streptomyces TaxID=1883 RepID=UPI000F76C362|nr:MULTISPECIES: hypothetical protein [Streptomyces]RST07400.1 hypothetical protein EF910_06905 [Streptomyces sp. WAC07149]GLX18816.1 hypothetical protein Slala01_24600 [Streptomyces lavendulae subsp. lavendulae]GLX29262.1 hypothetical protein Slala02_50820 [Streptomyces lavendulae subsp. lavendulae]